MVGSSVVKTDANGLATTTWTVGTIAQLYQLTVTAANVPQPTMVFVSAAHGPVASMEFTTNTMIVEGGPEVMHILGRDSFDNLFEVTGTDVDVTCDSRTPGIVNIDAAALTVSRVAPGQTVLACGIGAARSDSLLLISLPDHGIWIGALTGLFEIQSNTEFTATVDMDASRHSPSSIGSMTFTVTWDTTQMTYTGHTDLTWLAPVVNATESAHGRLTVAYASADGFTPWGWTSLLQLYFTTSAPGQTGELKVTVSEAADARTFADALPKFVALSQPLVLQ
jgi:DNA-binding beta-propeller fold protein YncE